MPRDVYSLNFFDKGVRPTQCVDADPTLPYCQLLGKYSHTLPGFSSLEPHSNYSETCAINWPEYTRDGPC